MKKATMLLIVLAVVALVAAGCAKKAMESEGAMDQPETAQPEDVQPAEPAPEADTQAVMEDQAEREKMAALNQFLNEYVHFDFDSAVLRSDAMAALRMKSQWVEENPDVASLTIEGHCDERGTEAYNMALGARRAEAVKQYMIDLGHTPDKFQTISYGEERPLDYGKNEEAWAKNRRASFVINE